jgi:peptide/nickel transport system permease protein
MENTQAETLAPVRDWRLSKRRTGVTNWRSIMAWSVAGIVLGTLILAWVFRGQISSYSASTVYADRSLLPIGSDGSPLGTDVLGRDLTARILTGVPISLLFGVVPAAAGMIVGMAIGLVAGVKGGAVDRVIMAVMDVLLAFPFILVAILAVTVLGPSLRNAMIAVTLAVLPKNARIIRAEVLSLRERDFILAARLAGAGDFRILTRHLFPNVAAIGLIVGSVDVGYMISSTAGLSFLGLGVQPPQVDWGTLIADGGQYITTAPQLALIPSLLVALVSLSFVLIGDDLRHRLGGAGSN